jgi:hypothetical protein
MIRSETMTNPAPRWRRSLLATVVSATGLLALLGGAPSAHAATRVAVFPIS